MSVQSFEDGLSSAAEGESAETATDGWRLKLLGMWELQLDGQHVHVPHRERRLITSLVLLGSRPRAFLSGLLWPDSSDDQAAGNLRSCVWRITHDLPKLLSNSRDPLMLDPAVQVDVNILTEKLNAIESAQDQRYSKRLVEALQNAELLPGWYDDWVIHSQEKIRQQRISALESMADNCLRAGSPGSAIAAALAAVAIDPLRESAHKLLIRGHLAAGNLASAHRVLGMFVARLDQELGIAPSPDLAALLAYPNGDGSPGHAGSGVPAPGAIGATG